MFKSTKLPQFQMSKFIAIYRTRKQAIKNSLDGLKELWLLDSYNFKTMKTASV